MSALTDLDARLVIAHRGNAAHAPENTLESFHQAVALGADALELDVRLSRDGVLVVLHDPTLARTTDRSGEVAALSAAEIRRGDAGARFTPDGGATFPYWERGLTIPTFADVLVNFPRVPLLIEVKVPEAATPLAEALKKAGRQTSVVAASMQRTAVAPLRVSGHATGASAGEVLRLIPQAFLDANPGKLPYAALCIPRWYNGIPVPVERLARVAKRAGVVTHLWTIDDAELAKTLWAMGVQGIVTNDPAKMLRVRSEIAENHR